MDGNEPYYVHGAGESKSLAIPSGASATSDTACVGQDEPTVRLFVKSSSASLLSRLKVEVLYEDAFGNVRSATIGSVPALGAISWTPHLPMLIGVNLLALVGDQTPVEFRFTAQGSASWQIDDVYVDPRQRQPRRPPDCEGSRAQARLPSCVRWRRRPRPCSRGHRGDCPGSPPSPL